MIKYTKEAIREKLFEMKDEAYRDFHSKLMPTVDKNRIIGVRTPALRTFAKEVYKSSDYGKFFKDLPHIYYEENNLHGILIEKINDFDTCIKELDRFLPHVDNWATCDLMNPKVLKKDKESLLACIDRWIGSRHTYTVRFGVKMLMTHFLSEDFLNEYPERVAKIKSDEYYVKMMCAWYFATALAKNYEETLPFIKKRRLDPWVHNKAIQKARESFRITKEQKTYLAGLKIK